MTWGESVTSPPHWATILRDEMHHGFNVLNRTIREIERTVMTTQDDINTFVQRLEAAVTAIRNELAQITAQNPALDVTKLDQAIQDVESLEVPVQPPPPPPPPTTGGTTSGGPVVNPGTAP